MIRALSILAMALATALAGCGQKGPLKLPEPAKPATPAAPATPAPPATPATP